MQFLLYEVVARIVAVYLCVECYRELQNGLVERKITIFSADFMNWILDSFLDESIKVVHRDTAPVRYWIQIGIQLSLVVGCLGVAIFGWWHPNT
jgi:hypothetical protein